MPKISFRPYRYIGTILFAASLAFLFNPVLTSINAAEETIPGKIQIAYELKLAGIRFARIYMNSEIRGNNYSVVVSAHSSFIAKLYPFSGATTSSGSIVRSVARPDKYTLAYEIGNRRKRIELGFTGANVTEIDIQPAPSPPPPGPPPRRPGGRVPLLAEHKQNVTDPIGTFILPFGDNEPNGEQACNRTQDVFDGRHRFEISMNYINTFHHPSSERPGEMVPVYVCGLKYRPIAGHRISTGDEMFDWANNDGVNIWLMPIYAASVYVPVRGVFPTPLGEAVFQANSLMVLDFEQAYGPEFRVETASGNQ